MNNILPFQYEARQIRVIRDDDGEAWFNAIDVCGALEMGNPSQAMRSHVDTDDIQKLEVIDSLGRIQRANHINESGLYALILGSTKPEARRFKRWVTHQVLPQIRKTGSYGKSMAAQPTLMDASARVDMILRAGEWLNTQKGVRVGMATTGVLDCLEKLSGVSLAPLRLALPPAHSEGPRCTLNATALGSLLNLSSRDTNLWLVELGYQHRNERGEWELSPAGQVWGEAIPFVRGSHAGYQILWSAKLADTLCGEQRCA